MVQLTKQLSGLLIVGTLVFAACQSSTVAPDNPVSVSLRVNQSARLSSGVAVRVDSIRDSRCPQDPKVYCVWAGEARVNVFLAKDIDSTSVSLALEPDPKANSTKRLDSTRVELSSQFYQVILREVNPRPSLDNQDLPKSAVVEVTKL